MPLSPRQLALPATRCHVKRVSQILATPTQQLISSVASVGRGLEAYGPGLLRSFCERHGLPTDGTARVPVTLEQIRTVARELNPSLPGAARPERMLGEISVVPQSTEDLLTTATFEQALGDFTGTPRDTTRWLHARSWFTYAWISHEFDLWYDQPWQLLTSVRLPLLLQLTPEGWAEIEALRQHFGITAPAAPAPSAHRR